MRNSDAFVKIIHPIFIICVPVFYLYSLSSLVSVLVTEYKLPLWLFLPSLFIIGLLTVVLGKINKAERLGSLPRIRELLVICITVYITASFLNPFPIAVKFYPTIINVSFSLYAAVQWIIYVYFQFVLSERELFLSEVEGKYGQELQNVVRDAITLSQDSIDGMKRILVMIDLFSIFEISVWVIFTLLGFNISLPATLSLFGCIVLPILSRLFLFQYQNEQLLAGEGLNIDVNTRGNRLMAGFVIIIISVFSAILFSQERSILPISWLLSFFEWFTRIFKVDNRIFKPSIQQSPINDDMIQALKRIVTNKTPIFNFEVIWRVLKTIGMVGLSIGLFWFIIRPLFSKQFYSIIKKRALFKFLKMKMSELMNFFRWLKQKDQENTNYDIDNLSIVKKKLLNLAQKQNRFGKRRELGYLVKHFLKLVKWGIKHNKQYLLSMTPLEFTKSLLDISELVGNDCISVGEIFEEGLYSNYSLSPSILKSFRIKVNNIIFKNDGDLSANLFE